MVGFISIYFHPKNIFEFGLLGNNKFNLKKNIELTSRDVLYPMLAEFKGMKYKVDEYRGYISGSLNLFYSREKKVNSIQNLSFNQLSESIDLLKETTIDIKSSKLSKLYFGLSIGTSIMGKILIKENILMLNLRGFSRNRNGTPRKELKLFELDDFSLGVFAIKRDSNKILHQLKIELRFKKSEKFKKIGINNIFDLKDKAKLRELFSIFLKKFDELTIVDTFNYEQFSIKDREKMRVYMNIESWTNYFSSDKERKRKSRARKDFERIQQQYNLNTIKEELRISLENKFEELLNN